MANIQHTKMGKKLTEKIAKSHSVKKSEAGNRMTASEILLQVHKLPEGVWARPNLCKLAQNKPGPVWKWFIRHLQKWIS